MDITNIFFCGVHLIFMGLASVFADASIVNVITENLFSYFSGSFRWIN